MKLYHYSNEDLTEIDPHTFGANSHTSGALCGSPIPRSYYYININYREKFFFGSKFRYTIDLDNSSKIYNTFIDSLFLLNKLPIDDLIKHLIRKDFDGLSFVNPSGNIIVCLFYSQKIIKKEVL